jgi:starvation-inducible DNA-binding protein
MNGLIKDLRLALAETWVFYFKAHSFHWNVRGPLYPQFHAFFGAIYEDAHDAVDGLAEQLVIVGQLAPFSPEEIIRPSFQSITSFDGVPSADEMLAQLAESNRAVIAALFKADETARSARLYGLSNYLEGRIGTHNVWSMKLQATLSADAGD